MWGSRKLPQLQINTPNNSAFIVSNSALQSLRSTYIIANKINIRVEQANVNSRGQKKSMAYFFPI